MQPPFKKILAFQDGYDDSISALEVASRLVAENVEINVIDVQPPLSEFWHELFDEQFEENPAHQRLKSLRELVKKVDFGQAVVTTQVPTGRPIVKLVQTVASAGHDLIVKEAGEKATDFLFGNLDMRLVRYSPVPVWIVSPERSHVQRVLVAINPEATIQETKLNLKLIGQGSKVAIKCKSKLYVVAAYRTPNKLFANSPDAASMRQLEKYEKEYSRRCRENLTQVLSESLKPVQPQDVIFEPGTPGDVIVGAVARIKPDLLVLGSIARQGISGLLIGNTAERVLRRVKCSILTVKPDNFVSPIAAAS